MNTIPTIFNQREIPYTILGNTNADEELLVSVLILNRGARYYLSSLLKQLSQLGLNSIAYVDKTKKNFDLDSLINDFSNVKFIFPSVDITIGEMINLGMSELHSKFVLVLWADMMISEKFLNEVLINKLSESKTLCVSPILSDEKNNKLPVQIVPSIANKDFFTEPFLCIKNFSRTLYCFDFIALYDRNKFIEIGGFDYNIENPYWQNIDFGFRANLWGYKFLVSNSLKIKYSVDFPIEDITADISYIKFYLKNLAIKIDNRGAYLPRGILFSYAKKSGLNPFNAYKYFNAVKDWVNINKYRFIQSPQKLISEWEPIV